MNDDTYDRKIISRSVLEGVGNEIKYWILDFGFCESGLLLKKHGSARRTATKPSGIFSCCF